jgi:iron(III) transport system ATP-binding protein
VLVAAIHVRNLTKTFEGSTAAAVDNISFDVPDGDVLTLLGPSGCGKTTTLRMLAGLEVPTSGEISQGNTLVSSSDQNLFVPPEKRDAGMVFQSYAIWPHMTVFENISYPLVIRKLKKEEIRQRVSEVLELLGLEGYETRSATRLSGGQQQRVAIARALVARPALLLLDEPLSNLDAKLRAHMRVELLQLQRHLKFTTVYVTHDQAEALVLSDRILVMNGGVIQQAGTPREIFTRPSNRFVADFIGFANFVPGKVVDRSGTDHVVRVGGEGPVIHAQQGRALETGAEVLISARPSALRLTRSDSSNGHSEGELQGTVLSAAYMGEYIEYHVANDFARLVINVSDQDLRPGDGGAPQVGDPVAVHFDPARTLVLASE